MLITDMTKKSIINNTLRIPIRKYNTSINSNVPKLTIRPGYVSPLKKSALKTIEKKITLFKISAGKENINHLSSLPLPYKENTIVKNKNLNSLRIPLETKKFIENKYNSKNLANENNMSQKATLTIKKVKNLLNKYLEIINPE